MADDEYAEESGEFDESDEHEDSHEEQETKFHSGDKTPDPYSEEGREELTEDEGEMTPAEEGFSKGASDGGSFAACDHCGKVLGARKDVVEKKAGDRSYWFCSDKCAAKGKSVR